MIRNLRNISEADIDFSPTINFLQGENGAGKTTVLEALYLAARSKSFKSGNNQSLIQHSKDQLTIYLNGVRTRGESVRIGLSKDKKNTNIKLNGESIKRLSDLAYNFPISLITPQTHKIFEEGPEYRRKLLNWGVFHVEHNFGVLMSNYLRVLNQRNQAIKDDKRNISIWDRQLIQFANEITSAQREYLKGWCLYLDEISRSEIAHKNLTIKHYQGWDEKLSLSEALKQKFDLDTRRGYTSVGPHRADLIFEIDGKPIKGYLSRGQQKKLIILLKIAQSLLMNSKKGDLPVLLMDDFQSELDEKSQNDILSLVTLHRMQAIITGIQNLKSPQNKDRAETYVFHVEHGRVRHTDCLSG